MSLSDFAYATPPEQQKVEDPKQTLYVQLDRRLIRENEKLQDVNRHLHAENQDLESRLRTVKRVSYCFAAIIAVMLIVSANMYQSMQQANTKLAHYEAENDSLADQIDSLQAQVDDLLSSTTVASTAKASTKTRTVGQTTSQTMVYVTPSGKRYHDSPRCAGYDPDCIPLSEAKARGFTPCKTCKPKE